eukprot:TRINITY_DN11281_c0_g1_i1.p1 TRINITY_DN11281_c0_g1~~TRINITY_DN11281_c0_g1_i1.p1  ORF type:complete len:224 (+),score=21.35 TRINITY_DN11281_c0_g1_i1:125-796(+)
MAGPSAAPCVIPVFVDPHADLPSTPSTPRLLPSAQPFSYEEVSPIPLMPPATVDCSMSLTEIFDLMGGHGKPVADTPAGRMTYFISAVDAFPPDEPSEDRTEVSSSMGSTTRSRVNLNIPQHLQTFPSAGEISTPSVQSHRLDSQSAFLGTSPPGYFQHRMSPSRSRATTAAGESVVGTDAGTLSGGRGRQGTLARAGGTQPSEWGVTPEDTSFALGRCTSQI